MKRIFYKGKRTKSQLLSTGIPTGGLQWCKPTDVIVGNLISLIIAAVFEYLLYPKDLLMEFCLLQVLVS